MRTRKLLIGGVIVGVVLSGCGGGGQTNAAGVRTIDVALTDESCQPIALSAVAGPTTVHVTNQDADGVTEFEILDGKKIIGEVENVVPGLDRSFSLTLKPGSFVIYCPGAKKERGTLEVAAGGTGQTADPAARKAAVDAYLTYVKKEADQLVADTGPFVVAVKAGDIAKAKALFATTRSHYETIEPIAESFGDLDAALDAREGDVPAVEWSGFHRIEKALWADGSLNGMSEVADKLVVDVAKLRSLIDSIELEPAKIANGAVELLNEVSASKITGEEDRYSHTDLADFEANVAGAKQAFEVVKELMAKNDKTLVETINGRFADVESALAPFKTSSGMASYTALTNANKTMLSQRIDALAEPLSRVAALVLQ